MPERKDTKDVLTKKDVHEFLWRGRDFELTSLWQRSIFLATFLVIIFTAYLGLWSAVLGRMHDTQAYISSTHYSPLGVLTIEASPNSGSATSPLAFLSNSKEFGVGFLVLSALGSCFSILWMLMAKGSKYWYERYEKSISAIEEDDRLFSDEINQDWERERIEAKLQHREEEQIPIHGYLRKGKTSSSLFSTKGGAYSVSRVNILIGVVFQIFWFFVQLFHVSTLFTLRSVWCRCICSIPIALLINAILMLFLGWKSQSGEARWNIRRTSLWDCSFTLHEEKGLSKRQTIQWLSKKLSVDDFTNYRHVFNSIGRRYTELTSIDQKKLERMIKKVINIDEAAPLLDYLQEHVIVYDFPTGMRKTWKSNGRVITLTPENSANLPDEWKQQIVEAITLSSNTVPEKRIRVQVFSAIPWGEINREGELRVSTEDYSAWDTTFVLCEQGFEDTAICTETFQFRKNSERSGSGRLNSTIHWMESNKKQEFKWNALPDPNQDNKTRTEEGNGK